MIPTSTVYAVIAAVAVANAVAVSTWGIGRLWRAEGRRGASLRALFDPAVARLGRWALSALPPTVRSGQQRLLARADLDAEVGVEIWMGLRTVILLAGCLSVALPAAADVSGSTWYLPAVIGLSAWAPVGYVRRRIKTRERQILKELPAYLDVLTVCVEAGATLSIALRIAVEKASPSATRSVFERLLREIRMGRSRIEALTHVARLYGIEGLTVLFDALVQSEGHGMSLGTVLRAQAQQRATERHLKAEKAALKAPVKMLGPLILCIFPCTFIVIAVPIVVRMFMEAR